MKNNLTEAFSLYTHGFSAPKKSRKAKASSFDLASWVRAHDAALMGLLSIGALMLLPLLVVALVAWTTRS